MMLRMFGQIHKLFVTVVFLQFASSSITTDFSLLTTPTLCPPGKEFCLQNGLCEDSCHDNIENVIMCNSNEMFCLETGSCVSIEHGCYGDSASRTYTVQCQDDQIFCLSSRRCINKDETCSVEDKKTICSSDEIFCLNEKHCVRLEQSCGDAYSGSGELYHCGDDEIFCLNQRRCVRPDQGCEYNSGGSGETYHCGDDEIFCLNHRRCVRPDEICEDDTGGSSEIYHCENDEIFCLSRKLCVKPDHGCGDDNGGSGETYHCGGDEIFCLNQRKCMRQDHGCGDDNSGSNEVYYCGDDEIFCLNQRRCMREGQDCGDDNGGFSEIYHCGDEEIFCLNQRQCRRQDQGCGVDDSGSSEIHHCGDDEIFCLNQRRCMKKDQGCEDNNGGSREIDHCGVDEVFCLNQRRCIRQEQGCGDDKGGSSEIYHCGDDEIFCLNQKLCVKPDHGCRDNNGGSSEIDHCEDYEVFCLNQRRCIRQEQGCGDDKGVSSEIYHCRDDEIFCLNQRQCMRQDKGCGDNNGGSGEVYHCEDDEIFCLNQRRCIRQDQGCENSNGGSGEIYYCRDDEIYCLNQRQCTSQDQGCGNNNSGSSEIYHCGDDEIFCLNQRQCTGQDQGCGTNKGASSEVYHCGDDEIFCLNERQCMRQDQGCGDNNGGSGEVYHCGDDEIFCLNERQCMRQDQGCGDNNGGSGEVYHCGDDEIFCLNERQCMRQDQGCGDNNGGSGEVYHCGDDEIFCLNERQCMRQDQGCGDNNGGSGESSEMYHCRDNDIFCLNERRCVGIYDGCDGESRNCSSNMVGCDQNPGHISNDKIICPQDNVFCLETRSCLTSLKECGPNSGSVSVCAGDKIFCLKTKSCVNMEEGCGPNPGSESDAKIICAEGKAFCLETRSCVNTKEGCSPIPESVSDAKIICAEDKIFCLETRSCVNTKEGCGPNPGSVSDVKIICAEDNFFCLETRSCVNTQEECIPNPGSVSDITITCAEDKIFCLETRSCVNSEEGCGTNPGSVLDAKIICAEKKIFCLETRSCVNTEERCGPNPGNVSDAKTICAEDKFFCFETRSCVNAKERCGQNPGNVSDAKIICAEDKILCFETRSCVNTKEGCGPYPGSVSDVNVICAGGKVFCVETRLCISPLNSCDPNPGSLSDVKVVCAWDEIFCIETNTCVSFLEGCDSNHGGVSDDKIICAEDEIFCLGTNSCKSHREPCNSKLNSTIVCDDNKVFCLESRTCLDEDLGCEIHPEVTAIIKVVCEGDKIYCLESRSCVDHPGECQTSSPTTDSVVELTSDSSTNHKVVCDQSQFFCIQIQQCIPSGNDCSRRVCSRQQYYCDILKSCIPNTEQCGVSTTSTAPPTSTALMCLDSEVFCIATRRCVDVSCTQKITREIDEWANRGTDNTTNKTTTTVETTSFENYTESERTSNTTAEASPAHSYTESEIANSTIPHTTTHKLISVDNYTESGQYHTTTKGSTEGQYNVTENIKHGMSESTDKHKMTKSTDHTTKSTEQRTESKGQNMTENIYSTTVSTMQHIVAESTDEHTNTERTLYTTVSKDQHTLSVSTTESADLQTESIVQNMTERIHHALGSTMQHIITENTNKHTMTDNPHHTVDSTDKHTMTESPHHTTESTDKHTMTESPHHTTESTDKHTMTKSPHHTIESTDKHTMTESPHHTTESTDKHTMTESPHHTIESTDKHTMTESPHHTTESTDKHTMTESPHHTTESTDKHTMTESPHHTTESTDKHTMTKSPHHTIESTDKHTMTESPHHTTESTDKHTMTESPHHTIESTDKHTMTESPHHTTESTDKHTMTESPHHTTESTDKHTMTESPHHTTESTDKHTMTESPHHTIESTDKHTMTESPHHTTESTDKHTMTESPYHTTESTDKHTMTESPHHAIESTEQHTMTESPHHTTESTDKHTVTKSPHYTTESSEQQTESIEQHMITASTEQQTMPKRTHPTPERRPQTTSSSTDAVTYAFAGNRVFLIEESLSADQYVTFNLKNLTKKMIGQVKHVRLQCPSGSAGSTLLKGKLTIDASSRIAIDDDIKWMTNGVPDGLITCKILDIPTRVAMGYNYHIGILAVPRHIPNPTVTMTTNTSSITEGTMFWYFRNPADVFEIHHTEHVPVIDSTLEILTNKANALQNFKETINTMQDNKLNSLHVTFHQRPLDTTGMPMADLHMWSSDQQWTKASYSGIKLDMKNARFRVALKSTYSGMLNLLFSVHIGIQTNNMVYTLEVTPVNDAPELISPDRVINLIESIMVLPYSGSKDFVIGTDIARKLLHDRDSDSGLGLAVLGTLSEDIGCWSYHDGSTWTNITAYKTLQTNIVNSDSINMSAILLGPSHKLRFTPTISSSWSQREAWVKTRLYVLGWDGTNSDHVTSDRMIDVELNPCATNKLCGPGGHSPYSSEIIPLFVGKAGCDDQPGSQMEEDTCGVCGGHDDCIDCNGTVHGDAIINPCGHCVGGSTGNAKNHGIDCRGQCNLHTAFSIPQLGISMCLPKSTDISAVISLYLFCDGQFVSDAYINKCNYCVLGNTTLPTDHGIGSCGTCDNDTSCFDCSGVPHGAKVRDTCNNCLLPADPTFNSGCQKLGSVNPTMIGASGRRKLRITGAELSNYNTATCRLQHASDSNKVISLVTGAGGFHGSQSVIMVSTEELQPSHVGVYHVFCVFDGNSATELELTDQQLTVFDFPSLDYISPAHMTIKDKPIVTVIGSGILDTSYLSCAIMCPYIDPAINCFSDRPRISGLIHFPAKRLNDSAVECNLMKMSRVRRAMGYQLAVLVEQPMYDGFHSLNFLEFGVLAPAPQLLSAQISSSYCMITLIFNMAVEGPKEHLLTPLTLSALGSGAHFMFMGSSLGVMVKRGKLKLKPGDTMTLQGGKIRPQNSHVNFTEYATGSVTLQAPTLHMPLEGVLYGPNGAVGSCDPFTLTLKMGKLGCAIIEFNWTVAVNDSNPTQEMSDDALSIQNRLNSLSSKGKSVTIQNDEILPGSDYIFTLTLLRPMDNTSTEISINVIRSNAVKPISVQLEMMSQSPDPRQPIRLRALLSTSNCSGLNLQQTEFLYSWKGNSGDFVIMSFMEFAVVKAGSLRGGSAYTMSVTVFVKDDDSIMDTAMVTFTTVSRPLEMFVSPNIQTLPYITTTLTVQGVDPNNMPDAAMFKWMWAKESEPEFPLYVMINNQRRLFEDFVKPSSNTDTTLNIPANVLPLGRYICTITMTKDIRSSSVSTVIEVVDNRAPLIELSSIEVTLNSQDPLRVGCKVTTYSKSPVKLYWDCASEENCFDLQQYSTISLMYSSDTPLSNYDFSLYLPGNLPTSGKLSLMVTAIAGQELLTTTETVTINFNAPPMIGYVEVLPNSGVAFETTFALSIDEAWIDPEGDTVSFYVYIKKIGTDVNKRLNARPLTDIVSYDLILPSGDFEIYLEVCDESQACAMTNTPPIVNVTPVVLTEAKVEETANNLADLLKVDMDSAVGMAIPLAEMMESGDNVDKLGEVVNEVAYNFLSSSSAEFDRDQAGNILGTAVSILESASKSGMLAPKVIEEAQTKAYQLAALVLGLANSVSGNTRRKRAVDNRVINSVSPMSHWEASTTLDTYSVTFSGQSEADITSAAAVNYLVAVDNVRIGLCAEVTYQEGATVVESSLETLRVIKRQVDAIATEVIDVTCQNCGVTHPALITYGESIQADFKLWNCNTNLQCNGGCLTTSQLTKDLVTVTSPQRFSMDLIRRSDIIILKMINPSTYDIMTVNNLTSPLQLTIMINGEVNMTEYSLQCKMWQNFTWVEEGCQTSLPEENNGTYHVNCTCHSLGIFSVFEAPLPETTTVAMTTTNMDATNTIDMTTNEEMSPPNDHTTTTPPTISSTTTSGTDVATTVVATTTLASRISVPKDTDKVYIMFKVHGVYDTVVEANKAGFLAHLRTDLATFMQIAESRIGNLKVTKGSIIINFELLSRARNTELTLGEVVYIVLQGVQTGSLPLTDLQGNSLVLDIHSFMWSTNPLEPPAETKSKMIVYIVGGAVGAFVLLMIMTGAFFYIFKIKAGKAHRVSQSPQPLYGQNMQGVDVPRFSNKQSPIVGNWVRNESEPAGSSSINYSIGQGEQPKDGTFDQELPQRHNVLSPITGTSENEKMYPSLSSKAPMPPIGV